ncbi:MAG: hypothetical protein HY909_15900 [Deltaproteobacteria bacterium]|nr:hypothetical protein [Deltaproteobacteria bacterium]
MKIIRNTFAMREAERQAQLGVDGKDRYVTEVLGLPPAEVERTSYVYRNAVQQVGDTGRLEELREDLRRGQDLQAIVGSPWPYTLGLVVVWGLEAAGSLLILRALGVPPEHRPLPALALTLAMIGLTKATIAATSAPRPLMVSGAPGADSGPGAPGAASAGADLDPNRPLPSPAVTPWRRYLLPIVYGCLVAAVAASRVLGSDAADVPAAVAWSEAAIMIAVTCGPAFAAIWLEGKRAPALELARRIALIRRRLRVEERRIRKAERFLTRLDRAQVRWAQDNATLRARFSVEHELATAMDRLAADDDGNDAAEGTAPPNGR